MCTFYKPCYFQKILKTVNKRGTSNAVIPRGLATSRVNQLLMCFEKIREFCDEIVQFSETVMFG